MFFRHEKKKEPTFDERLAALSEYGMVTARDNAGHVIAKRDKFGAYLKDLGEGRVAISKAGILHGDEVAVLVHGGYQMFFRTPSGTELPALAKQLQGLHSFDEDLREGLGMTSLYNLSLGTVCEDHMYDRVEDRDEPPHVKPWEKKSA